ncbi:MAG: hypothetical protein R6W80_08405 [Haliea sp.]
MNSAEINNWHRIIAPHRNRVDLATIICFWMNVERSSNWEVIYSDILSVCDGAIDSSMVHVNLGSLLSSNFIFGLKSDTPLTEDEKWFINYRSEICKITPFTDYYPQDDDGIALFHSEGKYPEHYLHQVLSNRELTQTFVNLDELIDRFHTQGLQYPDVLNCKLDTEKPSVVEQVFRVRVGEPGDPFRVYNLIGQVKRFLWSGEVKAGQDLIDMAPGIDTHEFNRVLAAVFGVSKAQARLLRIFTQDASQRDKGNGKNLEPILHPLMRVALFDSDTGPKFWSLKRAGFDQLDVVLSISQGERQVLLGILRPDQLIDPKKKATFANPGNSKMPPEQVYSSANSIAKAHLRGFKKKITDPAELRIYQDLRQFLLKI